MQTMLNSPQFLQQMSSMMSNPAVLDQIIAANPQLAAMGPQVREVFRSERFRQMMSDPETLRMMLQMSNRLSDAGLGPGMGMGGMGGLGAFGGAAAPAGGGFPAPGLTSAARQQQDQQQQGQQGQGTTPGAGSPQHQLPNPFMNPFFPFPPPNPNANANAGAAPADAGANTGAAGAAGAPPAGGNMFDLLAALGGLGAGGAGAGANPWMGGGGLGAFGAPAQPADTRPPEERFQVQLQVGGCFSHGPYVRALMSTGQQLQDMGFTNASQNVRALLATGGNVHSAIEYILNGGGL